jgi:hypothetical protein
MKLNTQRAPFFLGAAAALVLTFSTAAVYPQVSQDPTPAAPSTGSNSDSTTPAVPSFGKGAGRMGIGGDRQQLLADALGISVEDLQAAYGEAANAAIDEAVAQDLLTQTQADTLKQRLASAAANGMGFRLGGRGLDFLGANNIDGETLLADALGITVEELQTAYNDAEAAALAQAVADGQLTQEQANLVAAQQAFRDYVRSQQPSYEDQVQAALDAGAITQAQADLLLANPQGFGGRGFGGGNFGGDFGGRGMGGGMRGGHGRHGGMDWGNSPNGQGGAQEMQPDDSGAQSNSMFLVPNAGL